MPGGEELCTRRRVELLGLGRRGAGNFREDGERDFSFQLLKIVVKYV
jgi:hypothetical protein